LCDDGEVLLVFVVIEGVFIEICEDDVFGMWEMLLYVLVVWVIECGVVYVLCND